MINLLQGSGLFSAPSLNLEYGTHLIKINNLKNNSNMVIIVEICCCVIDQTHWLKKTAIYLLTILWVSNLGWINLGSSSAGIASGHSWGCSHLMTGLGLSGLAILTHMCRCWWWLLAGAYIFSRVFQSFLHWIWHLQQYEWRLQGLLKPKLHRCTMLFLLLFFFLVRVSHKATYNVRDGKINSICWWRSGKVTL